MGWKEVEWWHRLGEGVILKGIDPKTHAKVVVPNFPEDLNAIHEALNTKLNTLELRTKFLENAFRMALSRGKSFVDFIVEWTASDLCELLIKTVCHEKWVD